MVPEFQQQIRGAVRRIPDPTPYLYLDMLNQARCGWPCRSKRVERVAPGARWWGPLHRESPDALGGRRNLSPICGGASPANRHRSQLLKSEALRQR
jgi:hypothetical protein